MFQSFENTSNPAQGPERVAQLREWLAEKELDGFLVPRADEHQGEYVPARSERLQWLTGFTGSAGIALVLKDRALIFVDGRYAIQVRNQTDSRTFDYENLIETPPPAWLRENLKTGARIGFDPWVHTIDDVKKLRAAAEERGSELVALEQNPIDAIWADQPEAPLAPVEIHPAELAGELSKDKLARLADKLKKDGADYAVLTDPSSLAWTFNIRGGDVSHTPLALGFAILAAEGKPLLFLDERKLSIKTKAYLTQLADLFAPGDLDGELIRLAKAGKKIALDPVLAAERLRMLVEENGGAVIAKPDPARVPRAAKNQAELDGTRAAHRRDGAAVTKFLCWLDGQRPGSVDEIAAVRKLEEIRIATGEELQAPLRDLSFPSISGAGPNGAIMHYRVTTATNRKLGPNELFLIDSGAQYRDGTTDITRTVIIGQPTEEMRRHYTIVLKGLIAISLLRFPPGTRGMDIDAIARVAHWKAGLDYAHGTGHGVGSYLSVHEGPQRIARTGTEKLLAGMILSNEPGYYREEEYGIRLENLVVVTEAEEIPGGDIAMHGFETLTLAPFDRRLIDVEMLTEEEIDWLEDYHERVVDEIGPLLNGETLAWLEEATAPL
jgi:Xaa-Pro aminopeptidase